MAERFLLDIARLEITDDRGAARTVPFIDLVGPPRGFANAPHARALKVIRWTIFRRNWFLGGLLGGAISLTASIAFGSMLFSPFIRASNVTFLLAILASLPLLAVVYEFTALPIFRRIYRPAFLDSTLGQKLCPFCLYDLSLTEADADGRVVCPECAGAWNEIRFTDAARKLTNGFGGTALQSGVSLGGTVLQSGVPLGGTVLQSGVSLGGTALQSGVPLGGTALQSGVPFEGEERQSQDRPHPNTDSSNRT